MGGKRGPTRYEVAPVPKGTRKYDFRDSPCCIGPNVGAVLCAPLRHLGHDLGERAEVVVKLWANLCQGWPKKTLQDASEKEGKVVV